MSSLAGNQCPSPLDDRGCLDSSDGIRTHVSDVIGAARVRLYRPNAISPQIGAYEGNRTLLSLIDSQVYSPDYYAGIV